jgi:predicted RNA polymerase sigma factor
LVVQLDGASGFTHRRTHVAGRHADSALAIVEQLAKVLPALAGYHLGPAVRADFLARLGPRDVASFTKNERALPLKRAAAP